MGQKTISENDLERILGQLHSDEARAEVILKLMDRRTILSEKWLKIALDIYEKAGRFGDAAELAQKAGLTERAIDVYEKAGWFYDAAALAQKAGLTERVKLYKTIEELLE